MQAIVSLLDKEKEDYIKNIWKELEIKFNLVSIFENPIPHFSYLVTYESFNREQINPVLTKITGDIAPFKIRAHGLGIFRNPKKVIFIPVVRDKKLTAIQNELCNEISGTGIKISELYTPENWRPHITLSMGDTFPDNLGKIVFYLCHQDFDLVIDINNFAVIDTNSENEEEGIFLLGHK